jgi:hypothetical protein
MSAVGPDDGYDLALMAARHLTSLAAVAVATVPSFTLISNAAATRPAASAPQFAGAKSGTAVVLDPATAAVLGIAASHLRPAKSGTAVVLDPATGAVLRIAASHLRPAKSGTAAPTNVRTCSTRQLHIWVTHTDAGAGSVRGYLAFTNRGPSQCSLRGWPTMVALRDGSSTTAVRVSYGSVAGYAKPVHGVPLVRLRPRRTAVAAFVVADHGSSNGCPPPYNRLRVTPPGNAASAWITAWKLSYLGQTIPACSPIDVTMVVPASYLPTGH